MFYYMYLAQGVESAGSAARISALLREARLLTRAVLVDDALGIDALRCLAHGTALAVGAARGWVARV